LDEVLFVFALESEAADEFTNYNDTAIGIKAILLLERLGYEVIIPEHEESGRAWLSKGLLRDAKKIANKNIALLKKMITRENPLLGIEPSAILTFRDEYVDLADDEQFEAAQELEAFLAEGMRSQTVRTCGTRLERSLKRLNTPQRQKPSRAK
jgi:Fe-S oxidoreductase